MLPNNQRLGMSLLEWLRIPSLIRWWKYRNVDHFELRWREPGGKGWKQVDDYDQEFDPSDIDAPIPRSHFQTHAEARAYYQGEYRLIPIDEQGRMMNSVWQTWFYDGPSLEAERQAEQRKQERMQELLKEVEELSDRIEERRQEN